MSGYEAANDERASAIRALLAQPLIRRQRHPDMFRSVAVHFGELRDWFQLNLGWRLQVDRAAGIARLHKRTSHPDPRRGLRRRSSAGRPFDPLRYQLLSLVCAQLLRRTHTTLGDLADSLARLTGSDAALLDFEPRRHAHRVAFVDVLVWLRDMGALETTAGDLEGFALAERKDAVLRADTTVIPLLLSSDTPPSSVGLRREASGPEGWIKALTREPRYGTTAADPDGADRSQRVEWARHETLRRLLDDPALDLNALPSALRDYLQSPAGRDKVIREVAAAGLECERHVDVWLAVDPSGESSDAPPLFGSRSSVASQVAGILLRALAPTGEDGVRRLLPRSVSALEGALEAELKRHRGWAQGARKAGVSPTCAEAIELLESFGLVARVGEEVRPRPAAARYMVDMDRATSQEPASS